MKDYSDLNDNELISVAREHDENAMSILYEKYKPLINKKCSKYAKLINGKGIDYADLYQECMIGFEESVNNYNLDDDVMFYTFTNVCMDRQLNSLIIKINRYKNKLLNESVPLETIDDDNEFNLIDYIKDNKSNPELGLIDDIEYQDLYNNIVKVLTDFEECVFNLKLQNFDYREIASILDKEPKSIANALQRIKIKVRRVING